jgi:hypothetical protein
MDFYLQFQKHLFRKRKNDKKESSTLRWREGSQKEHGIKDGFCANAKSPYHL